MRLNHLKEKIVEAVRKQRKIVILNRSKGSGIVIMFRNEFLYKFSQQYSLQCIEI